MKIKFFPANRIYFILCGLSIAGLIIVGLIAPILLENKKESWNKTLTDKINYIENSVIETFQEKQENLINKFLDLKQIIKKTWVENPLNSEPMFKLLNSADWQGYSVFFTDNKNDPIAWSGNTDSDVLSKENKFQPGEIYFSSNELKTSISLKDSIKWGSEIYYLSLNQVIEKKYILQNDFYNPISLTKELINRHQTAFKINYSSEAELAKDGRFFSFIITNNFRNKIGVASFQKPVRDSELNLTGDFYSTLQSGFILLAIIFLGLGFIRELSQLKSNLLKFTIFFVYLLLIRYALLYLDIPSKFISGDLTNFSYFSSAFGNGVVKSLLELTISLIFLLFISIYAYLRMRKFLAGYRSGGQISFLFILYFLVFGALYFILLRSFGASIKSIINDSTLLYFKDASIIPQFPVLLMYFDVFILGCCFLLGASVLLTLILKKSNKINSPDRNKFILLVFMIFQIAGLIYDLVQPNPQGTHFTRVIFILFSFITAYHFIIGKEGKLQRFLPLFFMGSIISILLMIYYNGERERESIKNIALELIRPNENWLEFLVHETLLNSETRETAVNAFTERGVNFDAAAFKIWSNSALQREAISSEVNFLNLKKEYLGGFDFRYDNKFRKDWQSVSEEISDIQIFTEDLENSNDKIIRGIFLVKDDYRLRGYIDVSIIYNVYSFGLAETSDFLSSRKVYKSSIIDLEKLKIFDFLNGKVIKEYGDVNLDEHVSNLILNTEFSRLEEAWKKIKLNGEDHIMYIIRSRTDENSRLLAIALKQKELSFNIYDFFRVLFAHTLIILFIIIVYFIYNLSRGQKFYFGFRSRLLLAFLVISIIPLILSVIYFRSLTEEKNAASIDYKLGKRAIQVESYINNYLKSDSNNSEEIFEKALQDLSINFTLYKGNSRFYSSDEAYYRVGLFSQIINPLAFNAIYNEHKKEFVVREKIEKYNYNSYYYKANLAGESYTILVSDIFNQISLPMSEIEVDVFLFGSYSIAVILIIIFSTLLANQISSPISRLTKATRAVASGDLSLELKNNSRGEVQELVDGFNQMVRELKQNHVELAELEREAAWKEMAKQVAHEIKNPLTPMKLSIQQLIAAYKDKSDKFESIFEKVSSTLINQIETLTNIASEFSNFARMPKLKLQQVDLIEATRQGMALFFDESVEIKLLTALETVSVEADFDQVKRTLINLIRNSIQAGASKVEIRIGKDNNNYALRVVDNGSGIPHDLADKIFDVDFTTKISGMGLGLTMAKRFLESIGGSISVENSSPEGTTMLILLPPESV